jgi:hypothetical protein
MALATKQTMVAAGITPNYAQPLASENIIGEPGLFLHVKNGNASPCVVTMVDVGLTAAGSPALNRTVSVPATTGDKLIPLDSNLTQAATGFIVVTFSVQTTVTAALVKH